MWLLNTGHFTFWGNLPKATVTIVCVGRFNCNLAICFPINAALLAQNFVRIRRCLLKLCKCTDYRKVSLCSIILVMEIFCYRYSTTNNATKK